MKTTKQVDVLVVGAGPAGATTALNLAPYRTVLIADRAIEPARRVGESLLPASRRLLADMGLLDSFQKLPILSWYANQSVWGTESCEEADFLRSPDGHGWHIDRAEFERFLRKAAWQRGAEFLTPAWVESIARERETFRVMLRTNSGPAVVEARFLIDAGGRGSRIGPWLGSRRRTDQPLFCIGIYGRDSRGHEGAGITFTEAVNDGWWYTAPLPGQQRILAFYTGSGNSVRAHTRDALLTGFRQTARLFNFLNKAGFEPEDHHFVCAAGGSALDPCGGDRWLSTGDAALTFDPLSSQGLLNALFLGLAAAETAYSRLAGKTSAVAEYTSVVARIRAAYCRGLHDAYAQVRRWPASPFWRCRSALLPDVSRSTAPGLPHPAVHPLNIPS